MNIPVQNPPSNSEEVVAWIMRMAQNGTYRTSSARFKRRAVEALVSVLDPGENPTAEWLLEHVEDLGRRWANKHNASPGTIKTYVSRAKTALEDYLQYTADPKNFKPRGRQPKPAKKSPSQGASTGQKKRASSKSARPPHSRATSATSAAPLHDRIPDPHLRNFPLGKGRTPFLYAIPEDGFTAKDVLKVACHLVTLAEDFDPTSPTQAQMFALAVRENGN